jgi:hypothetical protein
MVWRPTRSTQPAPPRSVERGSYGMVERTAWVR